MPFETLPQMNAQAVGRNSLFHFAISSTVGLRVWYSFHSIIGFLSALFAGIMEASLVQAYSSSFPLSLILPKEPKKGRSLFARFSRAHQGSLLGETQSHQVDCCDLERSLVNLLVLDVFGPEDFLGVEFDSLRLRSTNNERRNTNVLARLDFGGDSRGVLPFLRIRLQVPTHELSCAIHHAQFVRDDHGGVVLSRDDLLHFEENLGPDRHVKGRRSLKRCGLDNRLCGFSSEFFNR